MENKNMQTPKIGLVLSGGGARGLSHIGVLKSLEEANIQIDYLSGTSMGGLVAAAYSAGLSPHEIENIALEHTAIRKIFALADPVLPRKGLLHGERVQAFLKEHIGERTFDQLNIPITLVTVDLNTGKEVHMNTGRVVDAVRATISIPGIFSPVERDSQRLVDGGLLNNLPVDVNKKMGAEFIVAVDVHPSYDGNSFWQELGQKKLFSWTIGDFIAVLGDSLEVVIEQQKNNMLKLNPPDILIEPAIPVSLSSITSYHRAAELIQIGYQATLEMVPSILDALEGIE